MNILYICISLVEMLTKFQTFVHATYTMILVKIFCASDECSNRFRAKLRKGSLLFCREKKEKKSFATRWHEMLIRPRSSNPSSPNVSFSPYRLLHLADGGAYTRVAEREATCDACVERAAAYYRRELQQRAINA